MPTIQFPEDKIKQIPSLEQSPNKDEIQKEIDKARSTGSKTVKRKVFNEETGRYEWVSESYYDTDIKPDFNPHNLITPWKRSPWVFTCDSWLKGQSSRHHSQKYLVWHCSPSEAQWTMRMRGANEKTKGGTVSHYWFDRYRDTYFDEPVIKMTLQTGYINPIFTKDGSYVIPEGLDNFYLFLDLFDELKIQTSDRQGKPNYVYIIYSSRVIPHMVLSGLFDPESLSWTDSADSPGQVNSWTVDFVVFDSIPKIYNYTDMLKKWNENIEASFTNVLSPSWIENWGNEPKNVKLP